MPLSAWTIAGMTEGMRPSMHSRDMACCPSSKTSFCIAAVAELVKRRDSGASDYSPPAKNATGGM